MARLVKITGTRPAGMGEHPLERSEDVLEGSVLTVPRIGAAYQFFRHDGPMLVTSIVQQISLLGPRTILFNTLNTKYRLELAIEDGTASLCLTKPPEEEK